MEGGAIIFKRKKDLERAKKMINFGITGPESIDELGINAKMNEFQAAMGLCILDEMEININARKFIWQHYSDALEHKVSLQKRNAFSSNNFSYFPVLLNESVDINYFTAHFLEKGVGVRRYFYPSLDSVLSLTDGKHEGCEVSRRVSNSIICLPIYAGMASDDVAKVIESEAWTSFNLHNGNF